MKEFDPQVEDRLLNAHISEESHGYSLKVKLHIVMKFEDHTDFPRLLDSS